MVVRMAKKGNLINHCRPKSAPTKKMTYIDEIFRYNQKKDYPKPGPGAYDITKKIPDLSKAPPPKAKDIKSIAERPNFLQDYEYLSDTKPGPGSFNPRVVYLCNLAYIAKIEDEQF